MKKTKKIVAIIIFLIILLMIQIHESSASTTGTVNEITVRIREKPSTSSKMLTFVTQDDKLEVLEKDGEWYKVKYKNYTGYIFAEYVKVNDESKLEKNNSSENKNDKADEEKTSNSNNENTNVNDNNIDQNENKDTDTVEVSSSTELVKEYKLDKNTKISIIPNINASIIYTVKEETKIEIIEMLNKWSYINIQGIKGWVRNDIIKEEDVINSSEEENTAKSNKDDENNKKESTEKVVYIKYDTVNLREKPSTSSKVISKLKLNTKVKITKDYDDSWYEVEVDGDKGYISKDLVSNTKQKEKDNSEATSRGGDTSRMEDIKTNEKEEVKADTDKTEKNKEVSSSKTDRTNNNRVTGDDIVEYAKKFLGCKYKYGGTSPSGFDCSGLTYYVYNHFGYKLNRSSAAQAKNGKYVEKSKLQKGDLVLFRKLGTTGNTIGHVGIYIGNNKFIEASDYSTGVIISSLNQKNYASRYITARRIINN